MKLNWNLVFAVIITFIAVVVLRGLGYAPEWFHVVGIFLVSYPYEFRKNVFSLFGGIAREGSIFSFCPLFQWAKGDVVAVTGVTLFQWASEGNTFQLAGIVLFQAAGADALQIAGVILLQGGRVASQILGVTLFQLAGPRAYQAVGFTLFQAGQSCHHGWFSIGLLKKETKKPA